MKIYKGKEMSIYDIIKKKIIKEVNQLKLITIENKKKIIKREVNILTVKDERQTISVMSLDLILLKKMTKRRQLFG